MFVLHLKPFLIIFALFLGRGCIGSGGASEYGCLHLYVCIELELKILILSSWEVKSEWKNLKFIVWVP